MSSNSRSTTQSVQSRLINIYDRRIDITIYTENRLLYGTHSISPSKHFIWNIPEQFGKNIPEMSAQKREHFFLLLFGTLFLQLKFQIVINYSEIIGYNFEINFRN